MAAPASSGQHPSPNDESNGSFVKRVVLPVLPALILLAALLTHSIHPSISDLAKAMALFVLSGSVGLLVVVVGHKSLLDDHFSRQRHGHDQLLSACLDDIRAEVGEVRTNLSALTERLPDYILTPQPMSDPDIEALANAGVLMTDERIAALESGESGQWEEIWIVTEDLHKDLPSSDPSDLSFNATVLANLRAGVRYVYFLPDVPGMKEDFRSDIADKAGPEAPLQAVWLPDDVWHQAPWTVGDSALYKRTGKESAVLEVPQTRSRFWIKVDDGTLIRKLRRSLRSCAAAAGDSLE